MELAHISDEEFDSHYPLKIRKVSGTQWTPISVVKKAIAYLGVDEQSILDIGSGAGKFCLIAGALVNSKIIGIEKKESLVKLSQKLMVEFGLKNVSFIHGDIKELDFSQFDHFYFFNAFEENVNLNDRLDRDLTIDPEYHQIMIDWLNQKFDEAPKGTKIVTYCGDCREIPDSYSLVKSSNRGKLRFWVKRD
ncbi:methyltransferase domain-containing protein [Algoriphagus lutimaris]|uniref:class I SAM-dependent methyltransferase n=1 Tax=Algoriphagus lutimaris TaxID=613197 RepID=UPI00196B03D8|nr:methyltransferase domain-containing protein [Algoriphagus lutimaris]MBN3519086.1 methyltransferase domain-containing protein [Algoriphagus lutimaris]